MHYIMQIEIMEEKKKSPDSSNIKHVSAVCALEHNTLQNDCFPNRLSVCFAYHQCSSANTIRHAINLQCMVGEQRATLMWPFKSPAAPSAVQTNQRHGKACCTNILYMECFSFLRQK